MHNEYLGRRTPLTGRADKTTLPMRGKWLNDADEVLSYLERHGQKEDSSHLLLKQAHDIIENASQRINQLENLTTIDPLTGITNRQGFMSAFARELDRIKRDDQTQQGGLLIMIDIDNFSAIESTYGADASRAALKITAHTLTGDIRTMDIAARLEDDEFVILFANTTRKNALGRAQSLIKKLNNLSFIWKEEEVPVRASLGLMEYKKGDSVDTVFRAVNQSLIGNKVQLNNVPIKQDNKYM